MSLSTPKNESLSVRQKTIISIIMSENAIIGSAEFVTIYEKFLAVKKILAKHFTKSHFYRVGLSFDNTDYVLSSDDYCVMEAVDGLSINFSVSKFVYDENVEIKTGINLNFIDGMYIFNILSIVLILYILAISSVPLSIPDIAPSVVSYKIGNTTANPTM